MQTHKLPKLDINAAEEMAKKTIQQILLLEGGPKLCKTYPDGFYTTPLWVPEWLKMQDAKDLFDHKNNMEESALTRIFAIAKQHRMRPELRFHTYYVHYSATHKDWYRHKNPAQQAIIRSAVYNTRECPRLCNEWGTFVDYALGQSQVGNYAENATDKRLPKHLAFYRFVEPVVQILDMPSPNPNAIFQCRYDPVRMYYFYLCFAKGVPAQVLESLLVGTVPGTL